MVTWNEFLSFGGFAHKMLTNNYVINTYIITCIFPNIINGNNLDINWSNEVKKNCKKNLMSY